MTGRQRNRRATLSKPKVFFSICAVVALTGVLFFKGGAEQNARAAAPFGKKQLAEQIGKRIVNSSRVEQGDRVVEYSIDSHLQQTIEQMIRKARVPYGAFVAMDPTTGQVLAMVTHGMSDENLALRATFPAASIFKVVTAAAAIERGTLSQHSLIPVRGSYHTLYKRNVLAGGGLDAENRPRYARLISFEDALAKSVNSVFGKVGIFGVGPDGLRKIASRFQFGKEIPFEMPVQPSQASIPDDEFGVAESASGYTRFNTLSPVHGALIAAAVANDGIMMEPSIVNKVASKDGKVEYSFEPHKLASVIDKQTADQLAHMMHRTITDGTSRRAFRGATRNLALSEVFIGGKTGTLNGWSPPGRYDWFVGFGERGTRKIAVCALMIHGSRHGTKSSQVARKAFETFFDSKIADQHPAKGKRS